MVRQYSSWKKNTTIVSQASGTSRIKQNRTLTTTTTATTTITSTLNESVVHLESIDNSERLKKKTSVVCFDSNCESAFHQFEVKFLSGGY